MEMTGTENSSAAALEKAIQVDPGFATRILTQANSAYFALPRKVTSIREAIVLVGFRAVRELAMTIGVFDMFLGKNDRGSLRRRAWWRLSLDAAVCAKALAAESRLVQPEEAYTCGLLHCIGKTLLDRSSSDDYTRVELLMEKGAPDMLAERAVYGCDHIDINVGACLMWGFPDELAQGLDYLSVPMPGQLASRLKAMTAIGARVARVATDGAALGEGSAELPQWALDSLGLPNSTSPQLVARGMQAIADAKLLLR